jgi:hypothetical protein
LPTDTERRLEALENLLLFGGGVTAGTASGRQLAAAAARRAPAVAVRGVGTAGRVGLAVARRHPVGTAATLAYLGYIHRDDIADVAETIGEGVQEVVPGVQASGKAARRKVSKANKAVKKAVDLLRAGTKGATGADKGKLPKNYWKMATTAAGLANPKTPSKITKGTSKVKRLARTLKKWWK